MFLEPHEGLSGDDAAGGADGLAPFMDGPLPLLLGTTCGAGPGPQRLAGAPGCPGCQAQDPGSTPSPSSVCCRTRPTVETWPGPHHTAAPTWGRAGHRGRHLLAGSAGEGRHLLPDILRAWALLLLGTVAAGFVFSLGQACVHRWRGAGVGPGHGHPAPAQPHRCPAGWHLTFESEGS